MGSNLNQMKSSLVFDRGPPMLTDTSMRSHMGRGSNGNAGQMRESMPIGGNLQRGPKTGIFSDNFEQKGMENVSYNNRNGRGGDRHSNRKTTDSNGTGIPRSLSNSRGNLVGYQARQSGPPLGQGRENSPNHGLGGYRKSYGNQETSGGLRVQSKGFRQSNIGSILF